MKHIKHIFDEIAAEPSTNKKMELLKKYKDTPLLKEVLYAAMSPRINYYIKQIPQPSRTGTAPLGDALKTLNSLKLRTVTGHAAQALLANVLNETSVENQEIIKKIIARDLRIGMGSTNVNKIIPKLIEETPYMGAKAFDKKLVEKLFANGKKAFSQIKMDGRYANALVRNGVVKLESRAGEDNTLSNAAFVKELATFSDSVLNGELTIPGVRRHVSNGIVASLVSIQCKIDKGENVQKEIRNFSDNEVEMTYAEALEKVVYTCWDMISIEEYTEQKSDVPYYKRLEKLENLIFAKALRNIKLIDSKEVHSAKEAMQHFNEQLAKDEEGTIVKAYDGPWKDGKPNHQIKMKLEMNVDLRVVDFELGTGKNSHVYSSLICQTDDGQIKSYVSGMNEKMMEFVTKNAATVKGKVVEVECSGLSKAKSHGHFSLLSPRFIKIRDDKNTTDSLQSAMQIEKMAKMLS